MSEKYTVSLRLNEKENTLIRNFAEIKGISISEFLRESALNEIKNQLDALTFDEAMSRHTDTTSLLTSEELKSRLGLL